MEPPRIEETANYREASKASVRFQEELACTAETRKSVAVVGGGLSGLACAKYLSDACHAATVYEARSPPPTPT